MNNNIKYISNNFETFQVKCLIFCTIMTVCSCYTEKSCANMTKNEGGIKMGTNNYAELVSRLEELIGGKENIKFFTHCVTRLRFNVENKELVKTEEIEKQKGVLGINWSNDQFQIIIGSNVEDVYNMVNNELKLDDKKQNLKTSDINHSADKTKKKRKISMGALLDFITGSIVPVLPILMAVGMIKVVVILGEMAGILTSGTGTDMVLTFVSDAGLYFLPIFVGASTAKKCGANSALGMFAGAMFLHPTFVTAVSKGTALSVFGIPVYAASYGSTIFPTIMTVFVMSYIEKFVSRNCPKAIRTLAEPFITMMITLVIGLCVVGPLGTIFGNYLATGIIWLHDHLGFVGITIFSSCFPLLVMTGMHQGTTPYVLQSIASLGKEPIVIIGSTIANINQGIACFAVALKSKDKELKAEAISCGVTAVVAQVVEPALYGITSKLKTPLYGAMIGSLVGAAYAGITKVMAYALAGGVFGIPTFLIGGKSNLVNYVIAIVLGIVVTFVSTYVMYKEEK